MTRLMFGFAVWMTASTWVTLAYADELPWIVISKDGKGFLQEASNKAFVPWGFNYDHDTEGRLIEDYWNDEWDKVQADFRKMRTLGANVVRIHLQFGKFMNAPDSPNQKALDRLAQLLRLAESTGLYLDLTGLGCYHKADVPEWYDKLDEHDRWNAQACFWRSVAATCATSPAVFCYDLMNEPVVPGGKSNDWLGPAFAGKHFVQFITLDLGNRSRVHAAQMWIRHLKAAIREKDQRHLITVGLVDWSLDRPGLTSGFIPQTIGQDLDFICIHLYPEKGKLDDAISTLKGFNIGKPVVIEETFPLKCSLPDFEQFIKRSEDHAAGCIGFFWGKTPDELRDSNTITDAIVREWLVYFQRSSFTEKLRK
jgi:hypothetical protein